MKVLPENENAFVLLQLFFFYGFKRDVSILKIFQFFGHLFVLILQE